MTSRCNHPSDQPCLPPQGPKSKSWTLTGIATLLLLCAVGSTSVSAQDDTGTNVPPAPRVKAVDTTPDADFKSPLKRGGAGVQDWATGDRPDGPPGMSGAQGGDPGMAPNFGGRRFRKRFVEGDDQMFGAGGPRRGGANGGPGFGPRGGGPGGEFGPPGGFHGMRGDRGGMRGFGGHRLDLTPLQLTDDQKSKIKEIRQANRERARDFRRTLMQKQQSLHQMIFSATATDAQIRAARHEVRKAQDNLEEVGLDDLLQIRALLTKEQRQRLPQIAPPPPGRGGDRTTASARTTARRIDK